MKTQPASEQMCVPNLDGAQTVHEETEPVLAKTQASTEHLCHHSTCRWGRGSKEVAQGSGQRVDGNKK